MERDFIFFIIFHFLVWTQLELKTLLFRIKKSIPAREVSCAYNRTQKALDWKQVAFSTYSPKECQAKWKQMCDKVRHTSAVDIGTGTSNHSIGTSIIIMALFCLIIYLVSIFFPPDAQAANYDRTPRGS